MFERVRTGWGLTKKAWGVIRSHPGLVRLPLTGGVLALFTFLILAIPGAMLLDADSTEGTIGGVVLVAIGVYLASFVVTYFNVALAAAADQALRGEPPDIRAAKRVARSRVGTIAAWALVSAVVSVVLSALADREGVAGRVWASIGGAIWSLVTFLVVPVVTFEGTGPFAAMKRAARLFRERWGPEVTGNVVIGGVAGVVVFVGFITALGGVVLLTADGTGAEVDRRRARHRGSDRLYCWSRVRRGYPGRVRRRPLSLCRRGPCARAVHGVGSRRRCPHPVTGTMSMAFQATARSSGG